MSKRKVKKLLKYGIPLGIIVGYRLIPEKVRGTWSAGTSSSHLALREPSWLALFRYGAPRIGLKGGNGWGFPSEYPRPKKLGLAAPSAPLFTWGADFIGMQMQAANTYNNGWPNGMLASMTTMKAFGLFVLAWFKLLLFLPVIIVLAILGINFQGLWGDDD